MPAQRKANWNALPTTPTPLAEAAELVGITVTTLRQSLYDRSETQGAMRKPDVPYELSKVGGRVFIQRLDAQTEAERAELSRMARIRAICETPAIQPKPAPRNLVPEDWD